MAIWFLGYLDQALGRIDEAVILAQPLAHPYSMVVALNRAAFLGQFCQDSQAIRQWAEAAVAIAAEHGFPRHAALGTILRGWALVRQGQEREGVAQIRQGLVVYRALGMGWRWKTPIFWRCWLSLCQQRRDRTGAGGSG